MAGKWYDSPDGFDPIGAHTSDGSLSAAKELTPPAGATKIKIQATGNNVRYTLDGTTPTASVGFRLTDGNDPLILSFGPNTTINVIEEAASGEISYQWGR